MPSPPQRQETSIVGRLVAQVQSCHRLLQLICRCTDRFSFGVSAGQRTSRLPSGLRRSPVAESKTPSSSANSLLIESLRIANCLLVIRDGPLGLGDRGVLLPEQVRPKPPINGFLVRLQRVLGQAKAGMKKRLIILVRSVETLNQSQQCCPVKICEFCFDICPRWLRFRLTFGHTRVHDSTHPGQAPEIWLVMSHTSHRHPWENNSHR